MTSASNGPAVRGTHRAPDEETPLPAGDEALGGIRPDEETPLPAGTPVARAGHLVVVLLDWEDQDFERAFERARAAVVAEGWIINGPRAAMRAEELLHAAGYPQARIGVERTVDEAMAHGARWTVSREGQQR
ncbi:MAG: hypothetical protein ABIR11_13885 [Candidatus Limnocylindrales bacterium]